MKMIEGLKLAFISLFIFYVPAFSVADSTSKMGILTYVSLFKDREKSIQKHQIEWGGKKGTIERIETNWDAILLRVLLNDKKETFKIADKTVSFHGVQIENPEQMIIVSNFHDVLDKFFNLNDDSGKTLLTLDAQDLSVTGFSIPLAIGSYGIYSLIRSNTDWAWNYLIADHFLGFSLVAPAAMVIKTFDRLGLYNFQEYPFEKNVGFLTKTSGKPWSLLAGISFSPKFYGLDASLQMIPLGFMAETRTATSFNLSQAGLTYCYAKNELMKFDVTGFYQAITETSSQKQTQGVGLDFTNHFFIKPIHLKMAASASTVGSSELSRRLIVEIGTYFQAYELAVGYDYFHFLEHENSGFKARLSLWI